MDSAKVRLKFHKKGKVVRIYHDGKYSHSMSVDDLLKLSNTFKDSVRATGPVSTVVTIVHEKDVEA